MELHIFDLSGSEVYAPVRQKYLEGATHFLLAYDVSDAKSFESCKQWMKTCGEIAHRDTLASPLFLLTSACVAAATPNGKPRGVLVGLKGDLAEQGEVRPEDAVGFAKVSPAQARVVASRDWAFSLPLSSLFLAFPFPCCSPASTQTHGLSHVVCSSLENKDVDTPFSLIAASVAANYDETAQAISEGHS